MTRTRVPSVLVTGATGRVGRIVIDQLLDADVPVRALARRSEAAAMPPAEVEVVAGDLAEPESLDAGLRGVDAVLLAWTAPEATAPAVVERLATYARRVDGGAPHRNRTAHRGQRTRVDNHPPGDVRFERAGPVVDRDPHRRCDPVALRRCRDRPCRRPRRRSRRGADPAARRTCRRCSPPGRNDRTAGVRHLDGVRHPPIGAQIVSPVGRRSCRRVHRRLIAR